MSSTRKVPNYYYIVAFLDSSKIYPTSFFSVFFLHFFSSIFFPTVFPVGENKGKKTAAGRKNSKKKKEKKRC
jgi:fucose permease